MRYLNLCPYELVLPPSRPRGPSVVLPRRRDERGDFLTVPTLVRTEERCGAFWGVALWSVRDEIRPALPPAVPGVTLLVAPDVAREAAVQGREDCAYPIMARYSTRCDGMAFYSPRTGTWQFETIEAQEEVPQWNRGV